MQISKKSQYGLRAMVYLAKTAKKSGKMPVAPAPLKDISASEEVPFDFLEKIISELEKAGLVIGKKGSGGGYILKGNAKKITVADIVAILEKTTTPVNCSFCGRSKKCAAKNVWRKVEVAINKTLKAITLADLIK